MRAPALALAQRTYERFHLASELVRKRTRARSPNLLGHDFGSPGSGVSVVGKSRYQPSRMFATTRDLKTHSSDELVSILSQHRALVLVNSAHSAVDDICAWTLIYQPAWDATGPTTAREGTCHTI